MTTMSVREFIIENFVTILPKYELPVLTWETCYEIDHNFQCSLYLKGCDTEVILCYRNNTMHISTHLLDGEKAMNVASELLTILHAMEEKEFTIPTDALEQKVDILRQITPTMVTNNNDDKRWSLSAISEVRLRHYRMKLAKAKLLSEILKLC